MHSRTNFLHLFLIVAFTGCAMAQERTDRAIRGSALAGLPAPARDPATPFATSVEETNEERPHTTFERMERNFNRAKFPSDEESHAPAGTVSVASLRQRISKAEVDLIQRAQKFARDGKHSQAIEFLKKSIQKTSPMPYVKSALAAEYLKIGDIHSALVYLKETVTLLPSFAANHSNLGYALYRMGETRGAERELREAILLDHNPPQAHFLLGMILLDRATPDAETQLRLAENEIADARLALAVYHAQRGEPDSVQESLLSYLRANPSLNPQSAAQWVAAAAALAQPSSAFGFAVASPE